ncbi:MAG: AAA family ATPase, partial [Deltaproteobacteria bacterium]|nr:AAA family ATPase [Deltaproteobacteria bacterium]
MKCPECKAENPETTKFCRKCGTELLLACPQCGAEILPEDDFCGKCGHTLSVNISAKAAGPNDFVLPIASGERKQVSVLFSDLSGYTAMTERLDPEEVREIMDRVFGKIRQVIEKYDGFIEKFVGDSAMAVFGVPSAHEDDPIRAIRAAMEIHAQVEGLSPEVEGKIGQALSMHSGINTGLVVTGQVDPDKGTHGLVGDTINLASRLEGLAKSGQILVGESTFNLTKSHFNFDCMEPAKVKGKAEPLPAFKLLSSKEGPLAVHRLQGVRADLIGRQKEMELLNRAVEKLKNGQGSIISIVGDAGTGKSRLVQDFKVTLNLKEIQWREGHAYPYTQNTPYYPLINLLTHAFRIQEGDNPEKIRGKIEAGIKILLWDRQEIIPHIGGLFSLSYPEIDDVSPEFLRSKLQEATLEILEALASRGPTVLWFEDLHWADTSYIDLLHLMLTRTNRPVAFILVYRPVFKLFPEGPSDELNWPYHEIVLQDLSRVDSQEMLKSLLHTEYLPAELEDFIRDKVEGNPFYLEEVVNSLIETGTLMRENGAWSLTRPITGLDIPPTIQGVLAARLDRLEREAKRILQEASVIGRAFFYEVLTRITQLNLPVDRYLTGLESLDLIRTRNREPDLEYIFKHALTQEVVYNGLLKKERHAIHERIAKVMEQLFADRLPEFYDALAYHFKKGLSNDKAAEYLIKAGEKSYKTLSNQEAKQYYQQAYDLLRAE